jgi:hypothetical protein
VTPSPSPTEADGSGTINAPGGQASFVIQDVHLGKYVRHSNPFFSYSDPGFPISFSTTKISSIVISGNQASFSGRAKLDQKHGGKVSFTVNVTDNSADGTSDTFSLSVSNGYSASGTLTSGNINIH